MKPIPSRELLWFRQANSNPPPGFYAFKDRYLRRFATRAGWDKQTIEHHCWSCHGTGIFFVVGGGTTCNRCDGSGVYRTTEHWLERWDLGGVIYHRPASWNEVPWPRPVVVGFIEGRIKHDAVPQAVARRTSRSPRPANRAPTACACAAGCTGGWGEPAKLTPLPLAVTVERKRKHEIMSEESNVKSAAAVAGAAPSCAPPPKFYWKQCYELDGSNKHWALCDTETDADGPPSRVSSADLVLANYWSDDLDQRPLPKLIVKLLNAHYAKAHNAAMSDGEKDQ